MDATVIAMPMARVERRARVTGELGVGKRMSRRPLGRRESQNLVARKDRTLLCTPSASLISLRESRSRTRVAVGAAPRAKAPARLRGEGAS